MEFNELYFRRDIVKSEKALEELYRYYDELKDQCWTDPTMTSRLTGLLIEKAIDLGEIEVAKQLSKDS